MGEMMGQSERTTERPDSFYKTRNKTILIQFSITKEFSEQVLISQTWGLNVNQWDENGNKLNSYAFHETNMTNLVLLH